jgi:hypothetical protein
MGIKSEGVALTSLDVAVWEMVLSWTYDVDPAMTHREYEIPTSALRRFVGEFTKTAEVLDSLKKLKSVEISFGSAENLYSGVSMIDTWRRVTKKDEYIAWSFPEPIRKLMSDMKAYAHIELAAIVAKKSSKYSTAIYKWLALEASKRKWVAGSDNRFCIPITPDELADIVDFARDEHGRYNIGKLTSVVLSHHEDYDSVRRFKASGKPIHEAKRGRPVGVYEFTVELQAPSPQHINAGYKPSYLRELNIGGVDDKRYVVRSDTWIRAQRAFLGDFPGYLHHNFWKLWMVALSEAVNEKPLTGGYHRRKYRGQSLLDQIETEGADYAAWGVIVEEAEVADLVDYLAADTTRATTVIGRAECDRRERAGWQADRKRSKIESYYDRHRSTSISDEWVTEETAVTVQAPDVDALGSVAVFDFEPNPKTIVMSFDTCSEIQLTFKPVHIDFLENMIFDVIRSGDVGGKLVKVVSTYTDPESGGLDTWETEINVSFEEWCALLTKLQIHLVGQEVYQ